MPREETSRLGDLVWVMRRDADPDIPVLKEAEVEYRGCNRGVGYLQFTR
jgi:hypothetical protein